MVIVALAAIVMEMLGHFPIVGRTWLFWSALVLVVAGFFGFALSPMLVRFGFRNRATDDELAAKIGQHYPTVSDRLVNVLQLMRPLASALSFAKNDSPIGSPSFAMAAFSNTYQDARGFDFNAIVDERPLRRSVLVFFLSLTIGAAFFIGAREDMLAASSRLEHFRTFYQKPAPFTFVIIPGDAHVMRGDSVIVYIATRGEQLKQIHLRTREEGQKDFDAITLNAVQFDSALAKAHGYKAGFTYAIHAEHPLEYFVEAREIRSPSITKFPCSIIPLCVRLNVEVDPPAYIAAESLSRLPKTSAILRA